MMDVVFVHVKFCKFITKFKKILFLEEGNIENESSPSGFQPYTHFHPS